MTSSNPWRWPRPTSARAGPSAVVSMCLSTVARRLQARAPTNPPPPFRGHFEAPRTGASLCSRSHGSPFSTSGPLSPSTFCRSRARRRGARRRTRAPRTSRATTRPGTPASPETGTARLHPGERSRRMPSSPSIRCSREGCTCSRGSTHCGRSPPSRGSRSSSRCLYSARSAARDSGRSARGDRCRFFSCIPWRSSSRRRTPNRSSFCCSSSPSG